MVPRGLWCSAYQHILGSLGSQTRRHQLHVDVDAAIVMDHIVLARYSGPGYLFPDRRVQSCCTRSQPAHRISSVAYCWAIDDHPGPSGARHLDLVQFRTLAEACAGDGAGDRTSAHLESSSGSVQCCGCRARVVSLPGATERVLPSRTRAAPSAAPALEILDWRWAGRMPSPWRSGAIASRSSTYRRPVSMARQRTADAEMMLMGLDQGTATRRHAIPTRSSMPCC